MAREEEIKNYAYNNCINDDIDDVSYSLIVETAEWADETMIEKACAWLKNNAENFTIDGGLSIECLICTFKKAMEE